MYNVLEKLRSGEPLTIKEHAIHKQGLISVLKKIHDDLDAAVFDAYGWPQDLTDEQILERLVALNHERAEEEKRGIIRWLRPDFQAPKAAPKQGTLLGMDVQPESDADREDTPKKKSKGGKGKVKGDAAAAPTAKPEITVWPKKLAERISAVRALFQNSTALSVEAVAKSFKGASDEDVESILESLAALGHLVTFKSGKVVQWQLAGGSVRPPSSRGGA